MFSQRKMFAMSMSGLGVEDIKKMSIREIKEELDKRGVKYSDLFEKSGFVERLAKSANERVDKMEPQGSQVENRANNETKQPEPAKASLEQSIREEVESMSLPSIRKELTSLGISTRGAFEKPEFVELLCKARIERKGTTNEPPSSSRSSEFRDVETKKMPREPSKETGAKSSGAGNPSAGGMPGMDSMFGGGRGGPNPFAGGNPFGGGGNPFSGGNPFAGQGRPGAGGFGGGGANMGAMGAILQKVMGNPQAMAFVQNAMKNPKVMAAMSEIQRDPSKAAKYMSDPEIGSMISQLRQFL